MSSNIDLVIFGARGDLARRKLLPALLGSLPIPLSYLKVKMLIMISTKKRGRGLVGGLPI
jgi:hypothetical protein